MTFNILVLPGDGIGREVMTPCLELLERATAKTGGVRLQLIEHEAGADLYRRTGVALPDEVMSAARAADAILLGAMGLPDVRYPGGTEIAPQLDLRERLALYAGVRPVRLFAGAPTPLVDPRARTINFVLVREQTEGLFAARQASQRDGEAVLEDRKSVV